MTTDNSSFPGLHYFSVDVETSALRADQGELLTIGAVALDEKGNVVDDFYVRIDVRLDPSWYDDNLPARTDTHKWWREQSQYARDEAYMDRTLKRVSLARASHLFRNWVLTYGSDWTERLFVASPDKFDWGWIDKMFQSNGVMDPFWYHGIDLWSLKHGFYAAGRKGSKKGQIDIKHRFTSHEPMVAHHALSDAFAAAQDLAEFLEKDVVDLDAPHLEGYVPEEVQDAAEEIEEQGDDDLPVVPRGEASGDGLQLDHPDTD